MRRPFRDGTLTVDPMPTICGRWRHSSSVPTPSQRAVVKYFWVVSALILVQILLGVVTAHYGVEGNGFYGFPLAEWLPYSIARTWHVQLGIFWIATAWLATGLYVGPAVSGVEPSWQRFGVNVLFGALLLVVVGSLAGQWLSIKQLLGTGLAWSSWDIAAYEYIDLGRLWQIALLVGLFLWLALMVRAVRPALRQGGEQRPLLALFLISCTAIAVFNIAALGYGRRSNLATVEYWRWWVVHLWVEGFFEVFATVVIAFLFARLKLVGMRTAGESSILAATIFLSGGIIGTLHHLYFSGTPTVTLALGSVFSALEVVPLLFVGFEAWENLRLSWNHQTGAVPGAPASGRALAASSAPRLLAARMLLFQRTEPDFAGKYGEFSAQLRNIPQRDGLRYEHGQPADCGRRRLGAMVAERAADSRRL